MNVENIQEAVKSMSPYSREATVRVLAGDTSTGTLHAARRELAARADKIQARNRHVADGGRQGIVTTAQAAYDDIAAELVDRGAL